MLEFDRPVTQAYVLRVAPGRESMLDECLAADRIVIGWSGLDGLLDESLPWTRFRGIVSDGYYADESSLRKAGAAAGHLWRFIREMKHNDYVVVPAPARQFYVARILAAAQQGNSSNVGYWRAVEWLNEKQPLDRQLASAALQSRMKVQGSTAGATDLLPAILAVLKDGKAIAAGEPAPSFELDMRQALLATTLDQLRFGRLDPFKFEKIVQVVLDSWGAVDSSITARSLDKGDDIVARVMPLGLFEFTLVVQVKHYNQVDRPLARHVVDELVSGMLKQDADLGAIITVGEIGEDTEAYVQELNDEGRRIVVVNGEQLAAMYLDRCVLQGQ